MHAHHTPILVEQRRQDLLADAAERRLVRRHRHTRWSPFRRLVP